MKILTINNEWRIAVDNHENYMPERYVSREGGDKVAGREAKRFEGWMRQSVFLSNERQACQWIAKTINHEGGEQSVIDSLTEIAEAVDKLIKEMESNQ